MNQPLQFVGSTIDDKYKILSLLGEGGMGSVYLAEQKDLSRKVVIKLLHVNLLQDSDAIARFEREAKLLSTLKHEHLVQLYSGGMYAEQIPYLAMEYIEGNTLADELAALKTLSWERTLRIGIQICKAMEFAHSNSVIHRDLKPSNIILQKSHHGDFVKVIDFGLARGFGSLDQTTLTGTGSLLGSPFYMSPELCSGEKPDHRTDIYSLACVLYECLSAHPPFDTDNAVALLYKHKHELPALISPRISGVAYTDDSQAGLPENLDAVILKALEKSPDRRYQSMSEFASALQGLIDGRTLQFDPSQLSVMKAENNSPQKTRMFLLFFMSCLILTAAGAIIFKAKELRTERSSYESSSDLSWNHLRQTEELIDKASKALSKHDKKKAANLAAQAWRQMLREIASRKGRDGQLEQEIRIMRKFAAISSLIQEVGKKQPSDEISEAQIMHNHLRAAQNYHDQALVLVLLSQGYLAADPFLAIHKLSEAAESFAMAQEHDESEKCLKLAMEIQQEKSLQGDTQIKIDLAKANTELIKGKKKQAIKLATSSLSSLRRLGPSTGQSTMLTIVADILLKSGDMEQAEDLYKEALRNLTLNDGAYRDCHLGLSFIFEQKQQYAQALTEQKYLLEHAHYHSDFGNQGLAETAIERLQEKQESTK